MSKNESRRERLNEEKPKSSGGISKVYYWIIGILFLVLILLIVFIFSRSGDKVNLGDEEDQSSLVEDTVEEENESESDTSSEPAEEGAEETEAPEGTENTDEASDTEEADKTESSTEDESEEDEETTNTDEIPHDPSYATDYSNGSADRVEIKNRVMEATGLGDDLIEEWVGNDGPGRVVATVSSPDQSETYEVYLQYGDGNWHVTGVE